MTMNIKRWALVRRNTGSVVRKFSTRAAGRMYKREMGKSTMALFDLSRGMFVR